MFYLYTFVTKGLHFVIVLLLVVNTLCNSLLIIDVESMVFQVFDFIVNVICLINVLRKEAIYMINTIISATLALGYPNGTL